MTLEQECLDLKQGEFAEFASPSSRTLIYVNPSENTEYVFVNAMSLNGGLYGNKRALNISRLHQLVTILSEGADVRLVKKRAAQADELWSRNYPLVDQRLPRSTIKDADVYFFQADGGAIKIGCARDVECRLNAIQIGNPLPIVCIGTMSGGFDLEQALHKKFVDANIRGEWFRPVASLLDLISKEATPW